jgi:hypothetical protein
MANQRVQYTFIGLAAGIVAVLGLLAFWGRILWLIPVTLVIAILTSLDAYLKLKNIWAKWLAFWLFGLSFFALCMTPALFTMLR